MRMDEEAVGSAQQFAVAGGLLVIFASVALAATSSFGSDPSSHDAAVDDVRAEALKQIALSASWQWNEGGTHVSGLHADGGLDVGDLVHFKGADWLAADDGSVGYAEAQTMWGVDGDGFHIRVRPIDATGLYDLSGLRVAYIAAWNDVAEVHANVGTDEQIVAGLRAQIDFAATDEATRERAILSALGADYDDRVHLTAGGPVLLVDTVAHAPGLVIVCLKGVTIAIAPNAVPAHKAIGAALGACPGDTPPGHVVSVPLLSVLGDVTLLEGDVYFDDVDYLAGALAPRWDPYDVVVIGSAAAPQALGQGSFPDGLRQHVADGGLLVVFGGTDEDGWLEQLASAAVATANQQASTPDTQHPVLTWPLAVDWEALGEGQRLSAQRFPDRVWQHVLAEADGVQLALSPMGAYPGLVAATSMRPEGEAGLALATDIFAYYARQDLMLDFGATVPKGIPVSSSAATVWGTDAGGNQVALRVHVLYWRG